MGDPSTSASGRRGPDPLIGRVINDRFRVSSLIARGGMGRVYRAEQAPLGREVALKVLNPNYEGENDPEFHKRFFLEASTCSKLTHPNTVTIFDYGRTDEDIYYIAMELLEGRTLHRCLREDGPLLPSRALHIGRQICRSLREAHALGVIHRDLKPANIFLVSHADEQDFVKVLDFGLVKNVADKSEDLTQTGLFMGSPKYMSPEQIQGERVDSRADIYSLGVIMYEMLTGFVPFTGSTSVNILMSHVHDEVPPMGVTNPSTQVPELVEGLVRKCMAKTPSDRFASMDDLLIALKQVAVDAGLPTSQDGMSSSEFLAGLPAGRPSQASRPPERSESGASAIGDGSFGPASASTTMTEIQTAGSRSMPWLVVALAATAVVVAFAALVMSSGGGRNQGAGEGAAIEGRTGEASADDGHGSNSAANSSSVMVSLRSTPSGAAVEVEGRRYGPTPADVEWTAGLATPGREVTLRFHKDGFRDFTVTRTVSGDHLEVNATLDPIGDDPQDQSDSADPAAASPPVSLPDGTQGTANQPSEGGGHGDDPRGAGRGRQQPGHAGSAADGPTGTGPTGTDPAGRGTGPGPRGYKQDPYE